MTDVKSATDNWIELRLPVATEYARMLRLIVSGMASRLDFDIDCLDDIKIAVEEAYLMAIACDFAKAVVVNLRYQDSSLEVIFQGVLPPKESQDDQMRKKVDYGMFIIEAVVDEAEFRSGPAGESLRLVKMLTTDPDGGAAGGSSA